MLGQGPCAAREQATWGGVLRRGEGNAGGVGRRAPVMGGRCEWPFQSKSSSAIHTGLCLITTTTQSSSPNLLLSTTVTLCTPTTIGSASPERDLTGAGRAGLAVGRVSVLPGRGTGKGVWAASSYDGEGSRCGRGGVAARNKRTNCFLH